MFCRGVPHLKTETAPKLAVTPPPSAKKIILNRVGEGEWWQGLDWRGKGSMLKGTGVAELKYIRIDRDETAKIKPAG